MAAKNAEFVERALALPVGARLLDLGCGFGRHAVSLALRGYHVAGLDLSRPLLHIARDLVKECSVEVEWIQRDMRELHGLQSFDTKWERQPQISESADAQAVAFSIVRLSPGVMR